ncbi:NAD(P)H-binding protein [Verrucosispora sp. WMMD573]|uniref:NAD(P)-dependent oxidoreductase n=1 Tax=Verrucosispora sp. WMMD573 TaxID=3015149 RepID=UPI00248B4E55|nr:NAD(P)H-binding protein [Verrucosispora sp. WMMD573]WBB56743.1 NAD(P)H-binding protein [Verrucosispora sp. WMMD573]
MSDVVVFGAAGTAGSRIVSEAYNRGHRVVAAVRRPEADASYLPAGVRVVTGDATSERSVRELAPEADALVVAIGGGDRTLWPDAARTLLAALRGMPAAPRVIHVGGGATLLNPAGDRLLDDPEFPDEYRDAALGQAEALDLYRASADGVTWTYVCPPPLEFHPGERTGQYRTGTDQPVTDAQGRSVLSYEDLAVVVVDEIENGRFPNMRFTAGY